MLLFLIVSVIHFLLSYWDIRLVASRDVRSGYSVVGGVPPGRIDLPSFVLVFIVLIRSFLYFFYDAGLDRSSSVTGC